MTDKEEIIQFLRNITYDIVPAGITAWSECKNNEVLDKDGDGHCPKHGDCGICRFEHMKRKGWLK